MDKLKAIIAREYLERVRSRWFAFATIFGPVFFAFLLFFPAWMQSRSEAGELRIAGVRVIDATNSPLGARLASEIAGGIDADTTGANVVRVSLDSLDAAVESAEALVLEQRLQGVLVLDPRTLASGSVRYAGSNATSLGDMQRLERLLSREVAAWRLEQAGLATAEARGLAELRVRVDAQRLSSGGGTASGRLNIVAAIAISLLLYFTIFFFGQAVLRGVIEEKQSRVAEVVISSVRPTTLLAGKVIGVGAVGLTQQLIWVAAGYLLAANRSRILGSLGADGMSFELPSFTPGDVALLLLFFLLGYAFYAALFATVGAIVTSEQEAQQAQLPVVLLLVGTVAFLQPIMAQPDGALAMVLSYLPFSAPIVMPLRLASTDVGWLETATVIVLLYGWCILAVVFAGRVYKTALLMYGQRPSVGRVLRWGVKS